MKRKIRLIDGEEKEVTVVSEPNEHMQVTVDHNDKHLFSLTHKHTGCRCVPGYFLSQENAEKAAEKLLSLPQDWSKLSLEEMTGSITAVLAYPKTIKILLGDLFVKEDRYDRTICNNRFVD